MSISFLNLHGSLKKEDWINPFTVYAYQNTIMYFPERDGFAHKHIEEITEEYFGYLSYNPNVRNTIVAVDLNSLPYFIEWFKKHIDSKKTNKNKFLVIFEPEDHINVLIKSFYEFQDAIRFLEISFNEERLANTWIGLPLYVTRFSASQHFISYFGRNSIEGYFPEKISFQVPETTTILKKYREFIINIREASFQTKNDFFEESGYEVFEFTNLKDLSDIELSTPSISELVLSKSKDSLKDNIEDWLKTNIQINYDFIYLFEQLKNKIESFVPIVKTPERNTSDSRKELNSLVQKYEELLRSKKNQFNLLSEKFEKETQDVYNFKRSATELFRIAEGFPRKAVLSQTLMVYIVVCLVGLLFGSMQSIIGNMLYVLFSIFFWFISFNFSFKKLFNDLRAVLDSEKMDAEMYYTKKNEQFINYRKLKVLENEIYNAYLNLTSVKKYIQKKNQIEGIFEFHNNTLENLSSNCLQLKNILKSFGIANQTSLDVKTNIQIKISFSTPPIENDYYSIMNVFKNNLGFSPIQLQNIEYPFYE